MGVKEHLGLSQEALLEEHETTLQLQLQARFGNPITCAAFDVASLHTFRLASKECCMLQAQAYRNPFLS